ncbi:MAG: DUF4293 domain-containing protein [Bacteroides sp.]|nr:DUF4293 domain-containing protein [Bacteroides sp.]
MVIQRIQSLLLLLSAVFSIVYLFVPYGYAPEGVTPLCCPAMWIMTALAAVLTLGDIFLYKNTTLQRRLIVVCGLLLVAVAVLSLLPVFGGSMAIGAGDLLLLGALINLGFAFRCIRADERLLRSLDRIR